MSNKRPLRGINNQLRMDGKNPPPIHSNENKMPSKAWKKKYKCKKLKGDHDYRVKILKMLRAGGWLWKNNSCGYYVVWECKGCTKLEYEFSVPNKKFDKYREIGKKYV